MSDKVTGTIDETKMSSSGKTLGLKVAGKWYSTKEFHWQSQVGKHITFVGSYVAIGDGGMTWANDILMAHASEPPSSPASNPAAYAPTPPPGMPLPPASNNLVVDRDGSIVAQALTKSCTGPGDDATVVWNRYQVFYAKYQEWVSGGPVDPEFNDDVPF